MGGNVWDEYGIKKRKAIPGLSLHCHLSHTSICITLALSHESIEY